MIAHQKATVGLATGAAGGGKKDGPRGSLVVPRDTRPTLAEIGINKKMSRDGDVGIATWLTEFRRFALFGRSEGRPAARQSAGLVQWGPRKPKLWFPGL